MSHGCVGADVAHLVLSVVPMRTLRGRAAAVVTSTTITLAGAALAATAMPARAAVPVRATCTQSHRVRVVGAVVDREGSAVVGATVVARPVGLPVTLGVAARPFETITDARGQFHFDALPPGTYWFVSFEVAATGSSPAVAVLDHLELRLRLDDDLVRS